jgi:hypothetical protein
MKNFPFFLSLRITILFLEENSKYFKLNFINHKLKILWQDLISQKLRYFLCQWLFKFNIEIE